MPCAAPALPSPLDKYHPTCLELSPSMQIHEDVVVHDALQNLTGELACNNALEDEDEYHELMDWIDGVTLGAEKVFEENFTGDPRATATLRVLSFQGLLSPEKVFQALIGIM